MLACIAHTYYIKNIGHGVLTLTFVDEGRLDKKELGKVEILRGTFEKANGFSGQVKLPGLAAYLRLQIMPLFTLEDAGPGVPVSAEP